MSYAIVASFAGSYRSKLASSSYCILEHGNNLYENCAYSPKEHISLFFSFPHNMIPLQHSFMFCGMKSSIVRFTACLSYQNAWIQRSSGHDTPHTLPMAS